MGESHLVEITKMKNLISVSDSKIRKGFYKEFPPDFLKFRMVYSIFQSIGFNPSESRILFVLEKCLHPKKAPLARGEG